jgi:hypothetical protein
VPDWLAVRHWRKAFSGPLGQFSLAAHSNVARGEIEQLAGDVWQLVRSPSTSSVLCLERLFRRAGLACAATPAVQRVAED